MGQASTFVDRLVVGGIKFCLETIVTDKLEFRVFEVSARIVAGSNVAIGGSPYSDINEPGISTGQRVARCIRKAIEKDRLLDILS